MLAVLAGGRREIGKVERLASLFFTKTTYAFLLALSVGVATLPFPFLPRQLTPISGFVRRVMRFALPAGAVAGHLSPTANALSDDHHPCHPPDHREWSQSPFSYELQHQGPVLFSLWK